MAHPAGLEPATLRGVKPQGSCHLSYGCKSPPCLRHGGRSGGGFLYLYSATNSARGAFVEAAGTRTPHGGFTSGDVPPNCPKQSLHYRSATPPYRAGIASRRRSFSSGPAHPVRWSLFDEEKKNYDAPAQAARGAADGSRTRDPQIGSLMLCQLSYRRIYRNEGGGEVFHSILAPIKTPISCIPQFPPGDRH